MLLSEIIYNILNLKAGGIRTDDEDLSDAQVAFIVNYYRAKLVKQDIKKNKRIGDSYIQNLGKVDVDVFDKNGCDPTRTCSIRTKLKIPKPIQLLSGETHGMGVLLTRIGLLNNIGDEISSPSFQSTNYNRAPWDRHAPFTGNLTKAYYQDGYVFVDNPPSDVIDCINIQGIFQDPLQAMQFRTCDCPLNEEDCFIGFDFEYPLEMDHVDTVLKMIVGSEFRTLYALPEDTLNDSQETNTVESS